MYNMICTADAVRRVLQKGVTATVELALRANPGNTSRTPSMPLETAADNKEMGRVLIRREGETIAAGGSRVLLRRPRPDVHRCGSRDLGMIQVMDWTFR